jgi:hypothetical protein
MPSIANRTIVTRALGIEETVLLSMSPLIREVAGLKRMRRWWLLVSRLVDKRKIESGVDLIHLVLHGKHFLKRVGKLLSQIHRKHIATDVAENRFTVFEADHVNVELIPAIAMHGHAWIMAQFGLFEIV